VRRHCPQCALPYCDTRLDCSLQQTSDSAIFTRQFMGNTRGPVRTGVAANWRPEPADCNVFGNGVLTRFADNGGCWSGLQMTDASVRFVRSIRSFDQLSRPYRLSTFERDHGGMHVWIGGHLGRLSCAPNDPYFWCLHSFVDYLFEDVKDRTPAAQWTYPPNNRVSFAHRGSTRMRPFNAFLNRDGLDDEAIGKGYMYERSPYDDPCTTDAQCSPIGCVAQSRLFLLLFNVKEQPWFSS